MPERSEDWLAQARRDIESARWQTEGGFFEWACFICQQSAEKALKAIYQGLGGDARGHSVLNLHSDTISEQLGWRESERLLHAGGRRTWAPLCRDDPTVL